MVRDNQAWIGEHEGGWFCQFVLRAYVARVALGIRRQVKRDDSISLVGVLSQTFKYVSNEVAKLRSKACFRAIAPALAAGRERFGFRLVHFSVQANHLHLVAEVDDGHALARGMQGLSVRIARALNRALARRGKVFADRYHAHVLRSPREVANAVAYVVGNAIVHAVRRGEKVHPDAIDPMSSGWERQIVVQPRTWLLTWGWLRAVP